MTSLWEKINQKLHAIVDRALDARSLALYDQYIRDVEAYGRQVKASAATMYAGIKANERRLVQHEERAQRLSARLDQLLSSGAEEAARLAQIELEVQQELVSTTRAQIANQETDYGHLLTGHVETDDRLEVLRTERPSVESLLAVVRAGQLMDQIELTLDGLAGLQETTAAGRIAAGIQQRFAEAELRWQLAAASIGADAASEEAAKIQVEDQLAERMQRLGLDQEE